MQIFPLSFIPTPFDFLKLNLVWRRQIQIMKKSKFNENFLKVSKINRYSNTKQFENYECLSKHEQFRPKFENLTDLNRSTI